VCARFAITHGPGERPRRPESAESSKTYPGAIWLGPWIIAVNSPADRTRPRDKILAEAKMAWDREHFVSKLADKLVAIIRRRHS